MTEDLQPAEPVNKLVAYKQLAVGQALGVDEILAQVRLIQEVMAKVMTEGEHFGTIPGCGDKKTLLQPGAQKLTMTFRLAPEYQIQESQLERGHKEYRIICTLKSIQSGTFVGQGVGCCSTMESKYRWRSAARKCPECGKETIIKGKAEYGGGWLCFAKKGGCGAKWPDGSAEIESQSEERIEHENPADHFNTILKMAKKRAFVDATITATAASDIFTQDIGDSETDLGQKERPVKPAKSAPKTPPKVAIEKIRLRFLTVIGERFETQIIGAWALDRGYLKEGMNLYQWPLDKVPTSKAALEVMINDCQAYVNGKGKATPQSELEAKIIAAGFTFDQFIGWAKGSGNLEDETQYPSFDDLPTNKTLHWLVNLNGILKAMQDAYSPASDAPSGPDHQTDADLL